jgi:hypothetical protein
MNEEWLMPGAIVPVNPDTTKALVDEIKRLIGVVGGMALQQAEKQEPVAYAVKTVGGKKWHSIHASKGASDKWLEYRIKEQAQGEQYEQHALYTTPQPQREWVGLTDEELAEFSDMKLGSYDLCLAVEAKLKERNHG